MLQAIIRLRRVIGIKSVGLDNVCAGCEVGQVDFLDDLWPGQAQQIVVTGQRLVVTFELPSTKIGFSQTLILDHRAHRTIEQQDSLAQRFLNRMHVHYPFAVSPFAA